MTLWFVVQEGYGAPYPDPLMSMWSTKELADAELKRLESDESPHRPNYFVSGPFEVDVANDSPIVYLGLEAVWIWIISRGGA